METTNTEKSIDVYSLVTNCIIELLEAGTIPWQKPWTQKGIPKNLLSKLPYGGVNSLLLNSLPFEHNLFLTWKQVKTIGGSILKGEKGNYVVFNKMIEKQVQNMGESKTEKQFFLRYYKVFNITQCRDLPEALLPKENEEHARIISCDVIVEEMQNRPRIQVGEKQAYYHPKDDYVNMPPIKTFRTAEAYYGVLFHELIHSTGHQTRLSRKEVTEKIVFGSESYSLEELTAEIGACFLKSFSGLPMDDLSQNASYIQNWLEVLKNDKRFIVKASS
jgi:antirestriction protein ArdC